MLRRLAHLVRRALHPRSALACGAMWASALVVGEARAASPYLEVPPTEEVLASPAYRYANMSDAEAYAELDRRKILYSKVGPVHGVRAPIRLTGRLHGVLIRSSLPPEERATTPFEILDARLALSLDDFAVVLARHDVEELVHYTMYRPNVPPPGARAVAAAPAAAGKVVAEAPATSPQKAAAPAQKAAAAEKPKPKRRANLDGKASQPGKQRAQGKSSDRKKDAPEFDCGHDHGAEESGDEVAPLDAELVDAERLADDGAKSARPAKRPAPKTPAKPAAQPAAKPAPRQAPGAARGASAPRAQKLRPVAVLDERPHGKWAPPGTRHPAGLAIDVGSLLKRDGSVLSVASHFRGKIGERTCGDLAPVPESAEAKELRAIVCESREAGIFTYALTPNFDAPHADHFHMEIKPQVTWFLYH